MKNSSPPFLYTNVTRCVLRIGAGQARFPEGLPTGQVIRLMISCFQNELNVSYWIGICFKPVPQGASDTNSPEFN